MKPANTLSHPCLRIRRLLSAATLTFLCFFTLVSLTGCITYYKPDPFSGMDMVRSDRKASIGASVNRYRAEAYFDGTDDTPHSNQTERVDSAYSRTDVILTALVDFERGAPLLVWLPITRVAQRNVEEGVWGVEHLWLGTMIRSQRGSPYGVLLGVGIPLNAPLGDLDRPDESHNGYFRTTAQMFYSNGLPRGRTGFRIRLGLGFHLDDRPDISGIFELPGETQFFVPIGRTLHAGVQIDAKFTLIADGSPHTPASRDAVAIGPRLRLFSKEGWHLEAGYRKEVIGYFSSAGGSWNVGISHDLPLLGSGR